RHCRTLPSACTCRVICRRASGSPGAMRGRPITYRRRATSLPRSSCRSDVSPTTGTSCPASTSARREGRAPASRPERRRPTPSTRSSTSTRPCAIPTIRAGCCRSTIVATTFTRATWVTARWATPSISRYSIDADQGMARLSGKIAAVTGGASGIGEATVRRFVAEGAKVVFADRDVDRGKRVAAEIGASALFVEAHMEREAEAAAFVQQAADRFGRLDVLVNNAGIRMYHTVVEASAESWDEILGVNLKGYAFC